MADIFVSYTSSDREWAFWIAQQLEKLDHTAHVHDWEIGPGGDIASWMEERHDNADNVLFVVSEVYLSKSYSRWERLAAQWAAAGERLNFALPVLIENCKLPTLLAQIKRCELFGLGEEEARAQLADYLKSGVRPQELMRFPGRAKLTAPTTDLRKTVSFPGVRQPRNLPLVSLGDLFKGRETALEDLRAALVGGKGAAVVGRTLHGLGGVGKTRLAIEYACRHEAEYSALLFVRADDPASLSAGVAALAGSDILDLAEKEVREDEVKIEAALRWLAANPTWLIILDNVDDDEAVRAVTELTARLTGGHVIVTARVANFPASIRKLSLDALDEDSATEFLLERTRDDRAAAPDDATQARELAHELGGLALGLEQAGAYIARQHIGFGRYLLLWREKRDSMLNWFDKSLMSYDHDVGLAATWTASVEKLSPQSRRQLDRLAFLAPDPIPDSLLDVAVPGEAADYDVYEARAGLYAYSLATQAKGEDGTAKGFVVHRLVQDFARRTMTDERRATALQEALGWVNSAVPFDADDVRTWPVLSALAPHALAVARRADEAGLAKPTDRLLNQLGLLFTAKARFAEAEPLYRRAVEINENVWGQDDPIVATGLNNLAELLYRTSRLAEAEPLFRRALDLDESSYGRDHPKVAIRLSNLAAMLHHTNRLDEAEPLFRRALAIGEASYGPDHPDLAIRLNNLASLLQDTRRLGEAEPLYRRALAIDEKSYGQDHRTVARDLNNLADLLAATYRTSEAEPLSRRALTIFEKSLGPDHPDTATVRENLASLLAVLGKGA